MVSQPIPFVAKQYRAGTIDIGPAEPTANSPNVSASVVSIKGTTNLTTEELESFSRDVLNLVSWPPVTGAQVSDLQKLHGTTPSILYSGSNALEPATAPWKSQLSEAPRHLRIVATFEPHLRQASVKKLKMLFEEFAESIGQPKVAVAKEELNALLTDTYKRSVLDPETRNFATAISLLQDFLRPHWSQISKEQLGGISGKLSDLAAHPELNPRLLERFYRDLVSVTGGRIAISLETDEDSSVDSSE
jgi:hypothetical protein